MRQLLLLLVLTIVPITYAAPPAPAAAAASAGHAFAGTDRTIWDLWFTVTVTQGQKKVPYQYYNERVELKKGRIWFQNNLWKKEEGFLNEEQLGTFAANDADLSPLFYNFHSTYRSTETKIDGTVKEGRQLVVSGSKAGSPFPVVRRGVAKKTIFSQFFPIWLGLRLASAKEGQTLGFTAIPEDKLDNGFVPASGSAKLEKPDDFAAKTKSRRISVNYQGQKTTWWVDANGSAVRIAIPPSIVVERVSKATAQKFLEADGG